MVFKSAMCSNITRNENNGIAYSTTGDARVDYFSMVVRETPKNELEVILNKAWRKSPLDTLKLIFQKRDCRGGSGEKDIFYHSMVWLWSEHPNTFLKNIEHIPTYGSYKDWCKIVEYDNTLRFVIASEFGKQLKKDMVNIDLDLQVSLCAKYAPTEKHEFDKKIPGFVNLIAKSYCDSLEINRKKAYRQGLSALRNKINIVESKMCSNHWQNIDYSKVPSQATKLYANAFRKHNPKEYQAWLDKVSTGESKVNSSQLHPHEIASEYIYNRSSENQLIEEMWKNLIDDTLEEGDFSNCVAMSDVSGSMTGLPMHVSITLGILVAKVAARQGSSFGNMMITFSERPEFIQLDESDKLIHNMNVLMGSGSDGFNTDLYRAFDIMIQKGIDCNVKPEDFPEKIIIFTDMQFDEACDPEYNGKDTIKLIDEMFEKSPYTRPAIVCWNLRNTGNVTATSETDGVALVSGFSKDTFKSIMNDIAMTPYDVMRSAIDNDRYSLLKL